MGLNSIMQIGTNIKRIRKEKGYTQKAFAELVKIPYTTYSNYENNNRVPSTERLEKIAAGLDVSVYDLMGYEYFDTKYPEAGKEFKEFDGFLNYLESIGYKVNIIPAGDPEDSEGSGASYEISGNKLSPVTLTNKEFEQLRSSSEDMIFSFLWKKQQQ